MPRPVISRIGNAVTPSPQVSTFVSLFALFVFPFACHGQQPDSDLMIEPPVANRPVNFSNLVGRFRIFSEVEPKKVAVEEPMTLRVKIEQLVGPSPENASPKRQDLRVFPDGMEQQFYIQALPQRDRKLDDKTWEFVYRLRPKTADVQRIPPLELAYWTPLFGGRFQQSLARPIAIEVSPGQFDAHKKSVNTIVAPSWMYSLTKIIPSQSTNKGPDFLLILSIIFGPILICVVLAFCWRQWCPSQSERMRRRQTQAASRALRALRQKRVRANVETTAKVFLQYCQDRFGVEAKTPTAEDVRLALAKFQVPVNDIEPALRLILKYHCQVYSRAKESGEMNAIEFCHQTEKMIRQLEDKATCG